jgi:hypothetical protein
VAGRPSKFNEERAKAITDRLRAGATRKAAVLSQGVAYDTFTGWLKRFPDFSTAVMRAEAEAELRFTARITKEVTDPEGDWRAAIDWLKRRRREEWGDNATLTILEKVAKEVASAEDGDLLKVLGYDATLPTP